MPAILKSRIVIALFPLLMLALQRYARPADAALRKGQTPPSLDGDVIPRREPRPLSRQEIFQVIQNDLAQRGALGRGELRPGDLNIQSSVPVLRVEMGLQVKKVGYDPIRHEVVFELWASHEPQYLPFEVTARRDPESLGLTSSLPGKPGDADRGDRIEGSARGQEVNWTRVKAPMLAKPGRLATLVMLGQNARITTTVVPLQPGVRGQFILVRDPATMRVMRAEVVDDGLLRTSF